MTPFWRDILDTPGQLTRVFSLFCLSLLFVGSVIVMMVVLIADPNAPLPPVIASFLAAILGFALNHLGVVLGQQQAASSVGVTAQALQAQLQSLAQLQAMRDGAATPPPQPPPPPPGGTPTAPNITNLRTDPVR